MNRSRWFWCAVGLAAVAGGAIEPAQAIPAFARKYGVSCTLCHAPFPRLNDFGQRFEARGFRMEEEPPANTVETGDPLLALPKEFPLSARFDLYASYKQQETARTDVEGPWQLKLLSAGPIASHLSYFFYFLVEKGDVVGFEDAYIQVTRPFGLPLDITAGQFQVSDPLFKRELRLMRNNYDIYETRVGRSVADLAYDRGVALTWYAPAALEVVAQVTNGNGIGPADDRDNFDVDRDKNASLRIARRFGPLRLGAFGLAGKETDRESGITNRTTFIGPDLALDLGGRWSVAMQYMVRRDDNAEFSADPGPPARTRGGFAEVNWFPDGPDGRFVISGLVNRIVSDDAAAESENVSLTLNYLLARNARVVVEGFRDRLLGRSRFSLGLVAAF